MIGNLKASRVGWEGYGGSGQTTIDSEGETEKGTLGDPRGLGRQESDPEREPDSLVETSGSRKVEVPRGETVASDTVEKRLFQ